MQDDRDDRYHHGRNRVDHTAAGEPCWVLRVMTDRCGDRRVRVETVRTREDR